MSEFNSFSYGLRAMIEEAGCPIGGKRLSPENDRADDSGLSIRGEDTHHIAARIAQKLRDAGFGARLSISCPLRKAAVEHRNCLRGSFLALPDALG